MKRSAIECNQQGLDLEQQGMIAEAEAKYSEAIQAEPHWSVPWYNLGLLYKRQGNWSASLRCNQRAVELDPHDQAGWWNLGIAATALGNWSEARRAWQGAGIEIPPGEGPVDLGLGPTPIRINPEDQGEVLWAWRIDPARAIIRSVPLPESEHRFGDLVLHDGAPNGYRMLRGREVAVFDELALLEPSSFSTYEVIVETPDPEEIQVLLDLAREQGVAAEDWSTIRMLCKLCSEGRPHEQHHWEADEDDRDLSERRLGLAAETEEEARRLLDLWTAARPRCTVRSARCVLRAKGSDGL